MKKKIIKCVSFVLAAVTLASSAQMTSVFGATKNVIQTRTLADIEDFPTSYRKGLQNVKSSFPNAKFVLYDTGLDWYKDVLTEENEMKYGRNLISSESPASWKQSSKQVEPGWVQASQSIVEHYMDPRNFLNEKDVFQFMSLAYDDNQTIEGTQTILDRTFMASRKIEDLDGNMITYAEAFWKAGKETGVSPYLLACRVRQEQSANSSMITGDYYSLSGYYNYFNIGAYGSTTNKILKNGLTYAKNKGWDTPYKSILGGAEVLSENYIDLGKDCLYLHHFNMIAYDGVVSYSPYMASTLAPYHESKNLANACESNSAAYTFIIPVYRNMPGGSKLPGGTSSNDCLLKGLSLSNGDVKLEDFSSYTYEYDITSEEQLQYVTVNAEMYSPASSISINGMTLMTNGATKVERVILLDQGFSELNINVCAENGVSKDYTINIFNNDGEVYYFSELVHIGDNEVVIDNAMTVQALKESVEKINCTFEIFDKNKTVKDDTDLVKTKDFLVIKDANNNIYYTGNITLKGDVDDNGVLDEIDIDLIKQHILEIKTFTVQELLAADIDNDGMVEIDDLGVVVSRIRGEQKALPTELVLNVKSVDDIYFGQKNPISIDTENGAFIAEGYLTYNEGEIEVIGEENSGSAHFIADGNEIMFDNGKETVQMSSVLRSGTIDLCVSVQNAYDWNKKEPIIIYGSKKSVNVFDHALQVVVKPNENIDEQSSAMCTVQNVSNDTLIDITLDFGDILKNESAQKEEIVQQMLPGEALDIALYADDELSVGRHNAEIKSKYKNSNGTVNVIKTPINFAVKTHICDMQVLEYDEYSHYSKCNVCEDETKEKHEFLELKESVFKCINCDYTKHIAINVLANNSNKGEQVFVPIVSINNQRINIEPEQVSWFVNGDIHKGKFLTNNFDKIVNTNAFCCVDLGKGIIVTKDFNFKNMSLLEENIFVDNMTCGSIHFRKGINHEYKLENGDWTKNSEFEGLIPNREYTIYHRMAGSDKVTQTKFVLSHMANKYTTNNTCGNNWEKMAMCEYCKASFKIELTDVVRNCVFGNYETVEKATCFSASREIAKCVFGCGNEIETSLSEARNHIFSNYVTDDNATCKNYGTATAECDFGCGETNQLIVESSSSGHKYMYEKISDATALTSERELGICEHCGKENVRTVDKTRLTVLTNIYINLSNAKSEQHGLPEISVNDKYLSIEDIVWKNDSNFELADLVSLEKGETYKLSTLKLKVADGYAISKSTNVYINGKLYSGSFTVVNGIAEFTDIGQFKL